MPFALLGHDAQAVPKLHILAMCPRSGSSKIAAYLLQQGVLMVNAATINLIIICLLGLASTYLDPGRYDAFKALLG